MVRMQVDAPTLDAAFISVLRVVPLDKCSALICGYEHSKNLEDVKWGLTEWNLDRAG